MPQVNGFITWVVAWALFIAVLIATTKLQPGEKIVSYLLWLMIILLIVTRYKEIATLLPVGVLSQGQA